MVVNSTKILDYLMVYLLVAFSGIPFFYRSRIEVMIVCMLIPLAVFIYRQRRIDKFIIYYVVAVMLLQVGQMLKFYYLPLSTFLGLHIRILFAYLTLKAVGHRLPTYYVNIILFSILVSWLFYLPSYLPGFEGMLKSSVAPYFKHPFLKASNYKVSDNLILYTINTKGEAVGWLKRNSGPFWEPGAFSGFIIIALIFHVIKSKSVFSKQNLLLMAGLITTFSTSGLLVLAYLIVAYFWLQRSVIKRIALVPLFLIGFAYLFVSIDFMGAKIQKKLSFTSQTYNTRFKSAQIDILDFAKSPWVGLGQAKETRFGGKTEKRVIHRNNGVTDFLATFGLFAFCLYFILILLSLNSLCRYHNYDTRFALFALGAVLLIGFSEVYFSKVFFIALSMMSVLYAKRSLYPQQNVSV